MKKYRKITWRDIPLFKNVPEKSWNDWRWQCRNAIRDAKTLSQVLHLSATEIHNIDETLVKFRMAITPYYAAVIDRAYQECSVRMQAVPSIEELHDSSNDMTDPLHEDENSPTPGLTHRYPDRVLFLVTHQCAMYCRHCTRRRLVGSHDAHLPKAQIDKGIAYIKKHKEIRDVLLSGGDPFVLSDEQLEYVIRRLRDIEHVEIIRIGTRTPVVLPMRITDSLVAMLRKYHPIYVNTHFNHQHEITHEAKEACARLADAGIPLGNQSVLLRDVNDCVHIMRKLVHELLMIRVKPYYIYQCDLSKGIAHFRTSIAKGIEIIESLRGHTTGMAVPTFVVDAPGGGGKIPLMPNYLLSQSDIRFVLRNYEGMITTYTQPPNIYSDCHCQFCEDHRYRPLDGVAKLLSGEKLFLRPENLRRKHRTQ
jgi:lysine 2,3-aminomutase